MCVPETILHHLQSNGRNKKLTLKKVIATLEEVYVDDEDEDEPKELETKKVIDFSLLSMEEKREIYFDRKR